jgi:hypothetical protein
MPFPPGTVPTAAQSSATSFSALLALYSIAQSPDSASQIQEIMRRQDMGENQKIEDIRRIMQEHQAAAPMSAPTVTSATIDRLHP